LAAHITGNIRAKIWRTWDLIEEHLGAEVVSINTDSLRFTCARKSTWLLQAWSPDLETRIGDFELKFKSGTVLHLQSGICLIEYEDGPCAEPDDARGVCSKKRLRHYESVDGKGRSHLELRKRGKPLLTAEMIREARGSVVDVPSRHVTHLSEALTQDRVADINTFDDPNNPEDDSTVDLTSNLLVLDFPTAGLTFERLNAGPLCGYPHDFDMVTGGHWENERKEEIRERAAPKSSARATRKARRRTVKKAHIAERAAQQAVGVDEPQEAVLPSIDVECEGAFGLTEPLAESAQLSDENPIERDPLPVIMDGPVQ
jgi:hypothetical protein